VPLVIVIFGVFELSGAGPILGASTVRAEGNVAAVVPKRPAPSNAAPPPTLVAPTPVPPTPTAVPTPQPTATPRPSTYVVQRGDELKNIAAEYGVSIWKIISANDIPNPDSLRVGQELRIPAD
jgi:LysM repeat protein